MRKVISCIIFFVVAGLSFSQVLLSDGRSCAYVPAKYASLVVNAAASANIPLIPFVRLLAQESNFNPVARHKNTDGTTDKGITQLNSAFMPDFMWFDNYGVAFNPDNPEEAIPVAARYVRRLYLSLGSWWLAFAAYNCGPGNVRKGNIPLQTRRTTDALFGY